MFHTDLHLIFLRFLLEQRVAVRPEEAPFRHRTVDGRDSRRPTGWRSRRLRHHRLRREFA